MDVQDQDYIDVEITDLPEKSIHAPKNIDHRKTIKLHKKGLSTSQIGKIQGCSHSNIVQVLHRYGIEQGEIKDYKENQTDIFYGIQHRIAKSITDEEIKKAPLGVKFMGLGVAFDKTRLLEGQASAINVNVLVDVLETIRSRD